MGTEAARVTDVTNVTIGFINPYTCTRARKNTLESKVTSVSSVTGNAGLTRLAADFVAAMPPEDWAVAAPDRHNREAVRLGLVERQKIAPGMYRYRRLAR